jgi:two-component sensor histidine kinase
MFERILKTTVKTRLWPLWARLLGAAGVVALCASVREWLPWLPSYPVMLVLVGVAVSAFAFGTAGGWFAILLGDIYAVSLFLPHDGLALRRSSDVLGLLIFDAIAATAVCLAARFYAVEEQLTTTAAGLSDARDELEAARRDRDLLLKEAGCRIKNNLMTLIGVLNVQQRSVTDEAARAALASASDRIQVFARVHDRLVASDASSAVEMAEFLRDLCADLAGALAGARPIALATAIEAAQLPQQKAVAVGLIVNELVTNALKHAFPGHAAGRVDVSFRREAGAFRLEVCDDGVGLSGMPRTREEGGSIGQLLVRAMAAQLGGGFEIRPGDSGGATAVVHWPQG